MKSLTSTFCVGVIVHALFANLAQGNVQLSTQPTWKKGYAAKISADYCPPGWAYYESTATCFEAFNDKLTHSQAQEYCSLHGGNLAAVTDAELDFVISQQWNVDSPWWMSYVIKRDANSTHWELASNEPMGRRRVSGFSNADIVMPTEEYPSNLANSAQLCVVLDVQSVVVFYLWQWKLHSCDTTSAFLCMRTPTQPCIDRKGNLVGEGEAYKPQGYDPCMQCKCQNGERSMCVQTQCAQPRCINFMPDPDVCCTYHCLDDDPSNPQQGIDVTDNMRWVLTMLTSFILLGMMLFMVYRMRQKRMAYLRYRAQQLQDGNMMDFEPGSGPPPPPNLDDIDGGGYREPPPPYSFFKVDLPTECPPPYEPTTIHPPDVNRNHDHRSSDLHGEEIALLASGTSEPTTPDPTMQADMPSESRAPPGYSASSSCPYIANSDGLSPDTERSIISTAENNGQERDMPETPETPTCPSSPVTLLPSINTTV